MNNNYFKVFDLDFEKMNQKLQQAPLRSVSTRKSNVLISFPDSQGKISEYNVVETSIFSSTDNTYQHPNIKTYIGFRTDNSGTRVRFSVTPQGLKAMISEPGRETIFIQPITKKSKKRYLIYSKSAKNDSTDNFRCLTKNLKNNKNTDALVTSKDANDQILRTFRIAITTTNEYTAFWDDGDASNGDARVDALAQVVSTLNRVNEVFEVDMAITFVLVDTADDPALDLIYSETDPYNIEAPTLFADIHTNLVNTVGLPDFDLGHLFAYDPNQSNGAAPGNICDDTVDGNGIAKGSAFSAHTFLDNDGGPYMSDFFDIDFVPHEIGHQMGANHTWSFQSEGAGVNMEPGSGTTIMGYAGITGRNDVQDHSDPYFHYASIDQILNAVSVPGNCAVTTPISNNPPIANAGPDYIIPNGTPFILKGSATDTDNGDILTYTWEQIDDGVTTNTNFTSTKTTGAVWRSRPPSTSPNRYMPILERVLTGQLTESNPVETLENTSWETVSTVARELNFGLTVRDRSVIGGVGQTPQSDFDEMKVTVDGSAGPFVVTSQTTNVFWPVASTQTVTWDVAGTDSGVINTPTVNILLSVDGGQSFSLTLASGVLNDGSQEVVVPQIINNTTAARIKVEANDNIFYAVNSSNFTIETTEFNITVSNPTVDVCLPNDEIVYNFIYNSFSGFSDTTVFSVLGLPGAFLATINPISTNQDNTTGTITISGISDLTTGVYNFSLQGTSGSIVKSTDLSFNVYPEMLSPVTLSSPEDAASNISLTTELTWEANVTASNYFIEIATNQDFTTVIESSNVQATSYTAASLNDSTQYFWRVTASNSCDTAEASAVNSFTTLGCNTYNSTENNITIPDNGGPDPHIITSTITVSEPIEIDDVNVTVNVQHAWAEDIALRLTSPEGTQVILLNRSCDGTDDIAVTFDDQADGTLVCSNTPPAIAGVVQSQTPLSILKDQNALGDWILEIIDIFPDQDGGEFLNFSIEICGVNPVLSVDEFSEDFDLSIWPNPSQGQLNVSLNLENNEAVHFHLYDLGGRLINQQSFSNPTNSFKELLQFDNLDPSLYILSIENGKKKMYRRIVFQ
ncbi:reprolysin-like metallopeptidase [Aquimarina sp. MMG016]|uniref:reprolysin-like metallopeptidase n=1 Tax=Aquimarina sp. MMG016 TaxID=2822690 RepID=UPI001B3A52A1|nr:M12 family metallo-peptidase [Aquimarina sp. MMG016]